LVHKFPVVEKKGLVNLLLINLQISVFVSPCIFCVHWYLLSTSNSSFFLFSFFFFFLGFPG
jgi:hypothetical protein